MIRRENENKSRPSLSFVGVDCHLVDRIGMVHGFLKIFRVDLC